MKIPFKLTTANAKRPKGFTLLELMITVAIIGIIASIALPSYRTYVVRAEIQSAFYELEKYKFYVKKYLQDNGDFSKLVDEYPGSPWKRLGVVSKMFEMEPQALNVGGYNESTNVATGVNYSKQYHIKRGWLANKNKFLLYVYINRWKLDKGGDAPYVLSYWVIKQSNGQFAYTCHSYNGNKGGWNKVGMRYLPVECRH